MQKQKSSVTLENQGQNAKNQKFVKELKKLLESTKKLKDQNLTSACFEIGKKISTQEKNSKEKINFEDLGKALASDRTNLSRFFLFFKTYEKLPVNSNLNWSHYRELLTVKDSKLRLKLEKSAQKENWTRDKLRFEIKKAKTPKENKKQIKRPTAPTYLYKATILKVVDGDTLILTIDLGFGTFREQRIRLAQINCPEIKTPQGQEAFEFTKSKLQNADFVMVKTNKVDIYGRFVGDIFFDPLILEGKPSKMSKDEIFLNGIYLNEEIVKAEMAVVY